MGSDGNTHCCPVPGLAVGLSVESLDMILKIVGELIYRYQLNRLNWFLRRLFRVPPDKFASWTPDWVPPYVLSRGYELWEQRQKNED